MIAAHCDFLIYCAYLKLLLTYLLYLLTHTMVHTGDGLHERTPEVHVCPTAPASVDRTLRTIRQRMVSIIVSR